METIELDGIGIRPEDNSLRVKGRVIHLEPKVMAVLQVLLDHPDSVVSRQALMDRVWADRVVGEEVLTRCISELRTALGDDARNPRFIQTVPKKGYRLLQTPAPSRSGTPSSWHRWSIAAVMVLSFSIAAAVGWWLSRSADPARMAGSPTLGAVADAPLRVGRTPTNIGALDLYLLGRHYWHERTPEGLARAEVYFRQAIEADPTIAEAYSGLADAYVLQTHYDGRDPATAIALAEPLVERALSLNPELADAYASRGILLQKRGDFAAAETALARALSLSPNHVMAHMWRGNAVLAMGRLTEAFEYYRTAFDLDPRNPAVAYNYVNTLIELGRYEEAREALAARLASEAAMLRLSAQLALQSGDWRAASGLAETMAEDPVGAALLRWQVELKRGNLSGAEAHLASAVSQAPDDERVYLAALEHRAENPGVLRFDTLLSSWERRDDVTDRVRLMARAWAAFERVRDGHPDTAVTELAGLLADFGDDYPPFRMKLMSHLLTALAETGQRAAYDRWRADALATVERFAASGWASFEFQVERGFLLAAAGDAAGAVASFRAADLVGDLSAARVSKDPRINDADLFKDFI